MGRMAMGVSNRAGNKMCSPERIIRSLFSVGQDPAELCPGQHLLPDAQRQVRHPEEEVLSEYQHQKQKT